MAANGEQVHNKRQGMKIGIIGAGNVGRTVGQSAVRAGHEVTFASADPATAEATAQAIGARAARSNREAVESADIVILALPPDVILQVATELGDALNGKIVVDLINRQTPDPNRDGCLSSAEEVQAAVPRARVVKALNTVFVARQAEPEVAGERADGYVAGDDDEAKRVVLAFVESIGLRPFDVGPLMAARTLEGMGWIHIFLASKHNWPWQSAWKIVGPTP